MPTSPGNRHPRSCLTHPDPFPVNGYGQFMVEAILVALLAGFLALGLARLALPAYNNLLSLDLTIDPDLLPWVLGMVVATGLLSGIYPALFLSGFQPAVVLKGGGGPPRAELLRRGLVVLQFAASTLLLIGTFTVHRQLQHIADRDLGYEAEGIIKVGTVLQGLRGQIEIAKAEYGRHPNVLSVTGTTWQSLLSPQTVTLRRTDREKGVKASGVGTDADFLDTYGLRLHEGRNMAFKEGRHLGMGPNEFLLNQAAVQALGFEGSPLGAELALTGVDEQRLYGRDEVLGTVVGVVEDFAYRSAHHPIGPLLIYQKYWLSAVHLRVRGQGLSETIAHLERTTRRFRPDLVFRYSFVDDELERAYIRERQIAALAFIAASLAIFVACLGLLGLAAFAAERRTKEIGIRKALGATVASIIRLLSGEFLRLVPLANVIAWPVAFVLCRRWLEGFAYRVELGPEVFVLSAVAAALVALATVIAQTARAATANPVDALRDE